MGGMAVHVDVKNGRIARIRPLRYDENTMKICRHTLYVKAAEQEWTLVRYYPLIKGLPISCTAF